MEDAHLLGEFLEVDSKSRLRITWKFASKAFLNDLDFNKYMIYLEAFCLSTKRDFPIITAAQL